MDNDHPLNLDEASEMLQNELSLFYDSVLSDIPQKTSSKKKEAKKKKKASPSQIYDTTKYILENYQPIGVDKYDSPIYQDDETEIMTAILNTMSKEKLEQLSEVLPHSRLYWHIFDMLNRQDYVYHAPKSKRQLSINTLIKHFSQSIKGKRQSARWDLRERFDHQSFTDQMKIMRLFLAGTKTDRDWCYRKMLKWWDDAIIPDLEKAWIEHKDQQCVKTAAMRLPEDFIKEHQEAMGQLDYKSVCHRLAYDENYVIDKNRLSPTDYCFIIAHAHRRISDQDADQLLFTHIKYLIGQKDEYWCMPEMFRTYYGRGVKDQIEDKARYVPSLLFYRSVGYMIWALGQSGNAPTIIKFHQWNKKLQNNMPQYLAKEMSKDQIYDFMTSDFHEYQKWNWGIFTKYAYETIPEFVPHDDSDND